ncbi:Uncharacterized [Syntrophomonas zehnderi OL-4]|uniref:Uncharacterized n=1 Tax=Syntrophomonas zehnderi OL-4 TaxID=690567 RepID=A0A0E4GD77_9FIRM|nr:YiiX/YebB-like N1pC/P60 family cysteine hydrolase [Syntrophomonas zehnderi]CFY01345.1 Uncharacterized [Syntrophomonas zehnderi OL-4]
MDNKLRIWFFPGILLLIIAMIGLDNLNVLNRQDSLLRTYANSLLKGHIGSGYGSAKWPDDPWEKLEPGDIMLGGWPNCAYGRYSHAGLYLGDGKVLESYVDCGVCIQSVNHYSQYTELCLLRVKAGSDLKAKIVRQVEKYEGQLFYPLAFKAGQRYWNCTKIIWKLYADQGIDLDSRQDLWISPESFLDAPSVSIIYRRGTE